MQLRSAKKTKALENNSLRKSEKTRRSFRVSGVQGAAVTAVSPVTISTVVRDSDLTTTTTSTPIRPSFVLRESTRDRSLDEGDAFDMEGWTSINGLLSTPGIHSNTHERHVYTSQTYSESENRTSRSPSRSSTSSDLSFYLQDEYFDINKKTDYTYAYSGSYKRDRLESGYITPNMSRRGIHSSGSSYNSMKKSNVNNNSMSYVSSAMSSIRKRLTTEFEEDVIEPSTSKYQNEFKHEGEFKRQREFVSNSSISHLYGLDSEEDMSDGELGLSHRSHRSGATYSTYTTDSTGRYQSAQAFHSGQSLWEMIKTVVTITTLTIIDTVSWTTQPVWRPIASLFTSVTSQSMSHHSSGSAASNLFTRCMSTFVLWDMWLLHRRRRSRTCCCVFLPLLLLLPLLFAASSSVFSNGLNSMWSVFSKSDASQRLPPIVPLTQHTTNVYEFTQINEQIQQLHRIVQLQQEQLQANKDKQLTEEDVRVILKEGMEALLLSINEQRNRDAMHLTSMQTGQEDRLHVLQVSIGDLISKFGSLSAEQQVALNNLKLHVGSQHNVSAATISRLAAELRGLNDEVHGLHINYQELTLGMRNCCRNATLDAAMIQAYVQDYLTQIIAGYRSSGGSTGSGFTDGGGGSGKTQESNSFDMWLRQTFINREDLHNQMDTFAKEISAKIAAMSMAKQDGSGAGGYPGVIIQGDAGNALNELYIRKIIEQELLKFGADKTDQADFALESAGGSVVNIRCTETYEKNRGLVSFFGFPLSYQYNLPRTIIQPGVNPGECWSFKGSIGYVVIELSAIITPTGFTLEHIPRSLSVTGNIDTSPRQFAVLGLEMENSVDGLSLGNYTYNKNGSPLQYFPIQAVNSGPFRYVELRIKNNHGNPHFTCLYRFRVHGNLYNL